MKKGIINLTKQEFEQALIELSLPKFRASQVSNWIYKFGKKSFQEMTNIDSKLQEQLNENFYIYRPKIANVLKSSDGTVKFLLKLEDNNTIETVFIPTESRNTICVSSQVGCRVGCHFCNTGYNGFVRNLSTEEIIGQVMAVKDHLNLWNSKDDRLSNVVFMGMGEPLFNIDNVLKSVDTLIDADFESISRRKIVISTSGIVPVLKKIIKNLKNRLAISLHAPNDEIRSQIMPINETYGLQSLTEVCREYSRFHPFLKITFEYLLLEGINDSPSCARQLLDLLKDINAKVNLIRFNSWPGRSFKPSSEKTIKEFARILEKEGLEAPIRERRGTDIMAACGQLQSQKIQ